MSGSIVAGREPRRASTTTVVTSVTPSPKPSNAPEDNHITLDFFHALLPGDVMVTLTYHGVDAATYDVGPFSMVSEVKAEGIGGMWVYVPPLSGRYYIDGMVCNGTAPVVLPTGTDTGGPTRRRY